MEVTKINFSEQIDNITNDLKRCCFVAFDAEFTAILTDERHKYRLFDTNEERYDRLKTDIDKMIMTQVGLTMFQYNRDQDSYIATSYTFHLCPQVFGDINQTFMFQASTLKFLARHNFDFNKAYTMFQYNRDQDSYIATSYTFHLCPQVFGDINQTFMFQASTLKFLARHNFDFNKFIYYGLPYLSRAEATRTRQLLAHGALFTHLTRALEMEEEKELQRHCSVVSKWLSTNEEGTTYLDVSSPVLRYLVHIEVRMRFPTVLTTDSLGNSHKILIYRDDKVQGANSAPMEVLQENLMNHLLGFSHVIELLAESKKPLVGHNMFLDVVLLHNQFIGPLPNKYSTFKRNINEMFPAIFDTKYISHEMGKTLSFDEVWKSNALQDLYEFFSEAKCKKLQRGINPIKLSTPFDEKQTYHEAGWDSYCSGHCFLRLCLWAVGERRGGVGASATPKEALAALASLRGRVNVIRGAVPYMNLVGEDPPTHRPCLLHVKSLKERVINVGKMASLLASFGSVDIKPYGSRTALIAANSHHTVNNILKQFRDSREYRVTKFSAYRHSTTGRLAVWGGAFITGSLVLYLLHNKVK